MNTVEYLDGEKERILKDIIDNHYDRLYEEMDNFILDINEEKNEKMIVKFDKKFVDLNETCEYKYRFNYDSPEFGCLIGWIIKEAGEEPTPLVRNR